jgi:hypothetical protein
LIRVAIRNELPNGLLDICVAQTGRRHGLGLFQTGAATGLRDPLDIDFSRFVDRRIFPSLLRMSVAAALARALSLLPTAAFAFAATGRAEQLHMSVGANARAGGEPIPKNRNEHRDNQVGSRRPAQNSLNPQMHGPIQGKSLLKL